MPCRCDDYGPARDGTEERLRETINELGQMVCFLCGELEYGGELSTYASDEAVKWWKRHQKEDTKRVLPKIRKLIAAGKKPDEVARQLIDAATKKHAVSSFHVEWFHKLAQQEHAAHLKDSKKAQTKRMEINRAKNKAKRNLSQSERTALGLSF